LSYLRRAALGQFAQCPGERFHDHGVSISDNQPTHVERSRGIATPSARSIVQRHRTDHRRTPPPAVWGPSPAPDFSIRQSSSAPHRSGDKTRKSIHVIPAVHAATKATNVIGVESAHCWWVRGEQLGGNEAIEWRVAAGESKSDSAHDVDRSATQLPGQATPYLPNGGGVERLRSGNTGIESGDETSNCGDRAWHVRDGYGVYTAVDSIGTVYRARMDRSRLTYHPVCTQPSARLFEIEVAVRDRDVD